MEVEGRSSPLAKAKERREEREEDGELRARAHEREEKKRKQALTVDLSIKDLPHGLPEVLGRGLEREREGGERFLFLEVEREDREGDGFAQLEGSRDSTVRHRGSRTGRGVEGGGEIVRCKRDEE